LVGAVGIEIASLTSKSFRENGVAPPPHSNWSRLEPCQTGDGFVHDNPRMLERAPNLIAAILTDHR
jgi:hypothetical protein